MNRREGKLERDGRLAHAGEIPDLLMATPEEVGRWIAAGRIKPSKTAQVWKKGRHVSVSYYDRHAVMGLRNQTQRWRDLDAGEESRDPRRAQKRRAREEDNLRKIAKARRKAAARRIREECGYGSYPDLFPMARAMNRKLVLVCGPTNSGKTYHALEMAARSATAQVLSPLRLLAFEHFEALQARGLDAGLVTGEEAINERQASHIARTIETANLKDPVECAVIDEIQMLDDAQRGWAWTIAMIGIPAETVVMTGSMDAIPLVERIAALTGEDLEVVVLERKSPLHALPEPVSYDDVGAGDALIAFSRRDVHDVRERLLGMGRTVAVVYGALGPEVRRAEAARFRCGAAEVLVATDAIGMGLNLGPVRRVLFTAMSKFDGRDDRPLTDSEIRQIGGRAGRYGTMGEGFAGVVGGRGAWRVKAALEKTGALNRERLIVMPDRDLVDLASEAFESDDIVMLLKHLRENLTQGSQLLEMADMDDMMRVAERVNPGGLKASQKFAYACAPVQTRSGRTLDQIGEYAREHAAGRPVRYAGRRPEESLESLEDQARQATLYLWLARRFGDRYPDAGAARDHRDVVNEAIEESLASGAVSPRRAAVPQHVRGRRERAFHANPR